MRGIVLRVRCALRRHWPASAALALVVAVVVGAVLTLIAGARRTGDAPRAFTAFLGGDVAGVVQQSSGAPRTAEVAALPGVRSVRAMTFLFAGIIGKGVGSENILTFSGDVPASSRLVAGRAPDPHDFHEFIADKAFLRNSHARLGQRFHVISWDQKQAAAGHGFDVSVKPAGPSFEGRLVGIVDSPDRLEADDSVIVFSRALLTKNVGLVTTLISVRVAPGVTTVDLRRSLDTLPHANTLDLQPGEVVSTNIRNAVDAQALGTWLMALVLALAALVVLGQLLTRHARLHEHEREHLAALGFTRGQIVLESVVRAAIPAGLGVLLAVGLAVVASGRFPVGFVRVLEPHPGTRFDATALVLGGGAVLLGIVAWVAVALLATRSRRDRRARPATGDSLSRRLPSPPAAVGAQFALAGRDGSSGGAGGTLVALAIVIAGIVGSTAFAKSLDRLFADRGRFGGNYTLAIGDNSDKTAAELRRAFAGAPDVGGLMVLTGASARVGGDSIGVVGVDTVQGGLEPVVLGGHAPAAPGEIALGRLTARDLHTGVGRRLRLKSGSSEASYRVVGTVVVPTVGGIDGVGEGAVVTAPGFRRVRLEADTNMAAVRVRAGAPTSAGQAIAKRAGLTGGPGDRPGVIVNVGRVRGVPALLAALLGILMLLTLFHALVVSIQGRRRDLAILRALGADSRWVGGRSTGRRPC